MIMLLLFGIGFIVLNAIITILICGYMNQKSADLLMKYYYEDKKRERKTFYFNNRFAKQIFLKVRPNTVVVK